MARPHLLRPSYLRAMQNFLTDLERGCTASRVDYVRMITDRPLGAALAEYLVGRNRLGGR